MSKYHINEKFFKTINTEEKAYVLGFLYADGYNREDKRLISIHLNKRDIDIFIKIKKCLESNHKITLTKANAIMLNIINQQLSEDLAKLGCFQKKSLILKFPSNSQVPEHLLRHFIRGYFDGDGCLHIAKSRLSLNIVGTKEVCGNILSIVKNKLDLKCRICQPANQKVSVFCVDGSQQILTLLRWLYKDATIYLDRKYQKFIEASYFIEERKFKMFIADSIVLNKVSDSRVSIICKAKSKKDVARIISKLNHYDGNPDERYLNNFYYSLKFIHNIREINEIPNYITLKNNTIYFDSGKWTEYPFQGKANYPLDNGSFCDRF